MVINIGISFGASLSRFLPSLPATVPVPRPGINEAASISKLTPNPLITSPFDTLLSAISAPRVAAVLPIPKAAAGAVPIPGTNAATADARSAVIAPILAKSIAVKPLPRVSFPLFWRSSLATPICCACI